MKHLYFLLTTVVSILLLSGQAMASPITDFNLAELAKNADAIVEGWSKPETNTSDRNIPVYVADHKQSITVGYGSIKQTNFKIARSYKGSFEKTTIPVYSYPKIERKIVRLVPNRKYILFLKKHPHKKGYIVLNSGRGQWMVFKYNGITKVKAWNQGITLRHSDKYQNYSELVQNIRWQLSNQEAKIK